MAPTRSKTGLLKIVSLLFFLPLLAGCGEGWETQVYRGVPYSADRTAGSGVMYVRINLMPERGPVIEAEQPENVPVLETPPEFVEPSTQPEAIQETKDILNTLDRDADKLFNDQQRK